MRPFLQNYSVSLLVFLSLATLGSAETLDLTSASIAEINAAFEAGTLTSEKLVEFCLARIEAYDAKGPKLNAVIALHPGALAAARALDEERRTSGPRSPLHGIPVVLKDNYDTFDLPTTAGSFMLQDSIPPDDAFVVKKLRDAGAIILAKLNMSEFASGATMSSLIGPMLNPHDLERSPAGSSGGTGVAIAAAYAPLGLGTDTGGSVRGPSAANGIVGLKTTHGLLSRDGIVPLRTVLRHRQPHGPQRLRCCRSARHHGRTRPSRRLDAQRRWKARDGLHPIPRRRSFERRPHRHRARLHGARSRRRLGHRSLARSHAPRGRCDRGRGVPKLATRSERRPLLDDPPARVPRRHPGLPRNSRRGLPEDGRGSRGTLDDADRTDERRIHPKSEALEPVQRGRRERHTRRLRIPRCPRPWVAARSELSSRG